MKKLKLNLSDYTDEQILVGREKGEDLRYKINIDYIYQAYDRIEVGIPEDVLATNPPFFESLFEKIIYSIGEKEFLKRFHFYGSHNVYSDLEEAIYNVKRDYKL